MYATGDAISVQRPGVCMRIVSVQDIREAQNAAFFKTA